MSRPTTRAADRSTEYIEATIGQFFDRSCRDAAMISPAYLRLWKDMHALVAAGGKRLRPQMVCLAYRAFGGTDVPRIAPVAAAAEMLHISMLIHDDIIDRDLVRYGVDNVTARYLKHYASYIGADSERQHYAESAALLAGDLLLSGAHQLIAGSDLPGDLKASVHAIFSRSVFEVAGGELIDTEAAFVDPADVQPLAIARYKTAGYSFISPLLIGTTLAEATTAQKSAVRQFAEHLGVAFQLQDDIISIYGDSAATGKSNTGDLREAKRTFLVECFEKLATPAQRQQFEKYFGNPRLTDGQAGTLRDLLAASGARARVELEIDRLQSQAHAALDSLKLDAKHHQEFTSLISRSLKRSQ